MEPLPPALPLPDPPLTDGVVLLRPWVPDDIEFVVRSCQDPEIPRYSPVIPVPYTEADAREWFEFQESMRLAGAGCELAITGAQDERRLGAVGIGGVDRMLATANIGYWLAPESRGHGYMRRAVALVVRWAFEELDLARVALTTDPDNVASQRVAEGCGFTREGRLRSHMLVRHTGRRRDSLVYGLLPGELRSF